ncbi:Six-bladed beta-propeller [Vigna unguiculata]|uniref:Six-bladed beta-propeller n=1 Tax=Vigna unguiculata TaxID=3917 RepID=A0A4D6MUZ9_VIGUN|nr:Six-bladed beta-propeller [Vigna unguiculata]
MALRHRLTKELPKFLSPVTQAGVCCHQSSKALNLVALSVMLVPSARNPAANWNQVRGFHEHRISTMADKLHEPATEIDLLSFIKASLDEFEGTHHYWLNRSEKIDQLFGTDGIFLVLAASNFNCDITLNKLKTIQKRFPHINIIGLGAIASSSDQVHLMQLLMAENIAFPILLSQQTFPKIEKGACYMLFKNFRSPVIYHEKDASLEILSQAVQELDEKVRGNSKSLDVVRCTSLEQHWIIKDLCSFSTLQNLLLYYPGCVSADESHNRLFLSDCNHHRILVSDGNGEILDSIGSSPGFEDGDFESAKLRRPAGSCYDPTEDCLYFVDSENHAIRKADMGARTVDTLYPTSTSNKGGIRIWNWIMTKLGLESSGKTNVEKTSEVFDSTSLYFPWHLLKSVDDTLYIIDRRFRTLWIMDICSGKINEVLEGSPRILEICGQSIMKRLSVIDRIPSDWFQHETKSASLLEGLPHSDLLSSLATLQNHIFVCDPVGQRVLKVCGESGVCSNFGLSNIGILGLPYWLNFPLETFYAVGNGLLGTPIDHVEYLDLLPGRIDIHLNVNIPVDIELIEPVQESCIWCQTRGAATEISGVDEVPGSLYKAGVAQQWYDELDDLAAPKRESEINVQDDNLDKNSVVEDDEKVRISCGVCTSPGTSEVIIYAVLHCKLRRIPNSNEGNREEHAGRIVDILTSKRSGKIERDLWSASLLQSKGDIRDLIFMLPLHVRIRLNSLDHPKAENGRDIILTDSSIKVNVVLS